MARHLIRVAGWYYYRRRIPRDLQSIFPTEFIKASLHTNDRGDAEGQAASISQWCHRVYSLLRAGNLSPTETAALITGCPIRASFQKLVIGSEKPSQQQFSISEVYEVYKTESLRANRWRAKTQTDQQQMLNLFVELMGANVPIRQIDRLQLVSVREAICRLPANISKAKAFRDKSPREILQMEGITPMSNTRSYRIVSHLSAFLRWSYRHGYTTEDLSVGLYMPKKREQRQSEERSIYSTEDLKRMFDAPIYQGQECLDRPENFWVPLIAMYSGMRLNEICQLYVEDIIVESEIPCFDINEKADKVLKNPASRRIVPIHPDLVKLGLLTYVETLRRQGLPRLWMNLTRREDSYAKQFSAYFQRFNRKYITQDATKVFHSFRHMFATGLKNAGVRAEIISELLGHTHGSITLDRYGKPFDAVTLLKAMRSLRFVPSLSPLVKVAAFVLDRTRHKHSPDA